MIGEASRWRDMVEKLRLQKAQGSGWDYKGLCKRWLLEEFERALLRVKVPNVPTPRAQELYLRLLGASTLSPEQQASALST
jgi:hypothetical protein